MLLGEEIKRKCSFFYFKIRLKYIIIKKFSYYFLFCIYVVFFFYIIFDLINTELRYG